MKPYRIKRLTWLVGILLLAGCASVLKVKEVPPITLGEPAFYPTIEAHSDAPIIAGNRIEILRNGDETFPVMLREIKKAKKTITFGQYLYEDGTIAKEVAEAFAERCQKGVIVNILLDSHGSSNMPSDILGIMKDGGCHVEHFRRVEAEGIIFPWKLLRYNYRSHRRILVVDGRVGFTGGYGISEAWTGNGRMRDHWRDTNVRIEGPAVQSLQAAFAEDWLEATGEAIGGDVYFPRLEPRGDIPVQVVKSSPTNGSFQCYMLFLLMINSAQKSIVITNPYFMPDQVISDALVKAAARGVKVNILLPGEIDSELTRTSSRSKYGPLLEGGVKIYEYQAGLLHAKTMAIDSAWATIGSTNFDNRSFAMNQELNITIYDGKLATRMEEIFREDLKHAKPVTYDEWKERGLYERIVEWFAFPVKDML